MGYYKGIISSLCQQYTIIKKRFPKPSKPKTVQNTLYPI